MISLEHVTKQYRETRVVAVDDVTLQVPEGMTVALIGPSGCGKTTTMRMINRLVDPTRGKILVNGEDVTQVDPVLLRRHIGYVIQQVGLFPHMTIAQNIASVPKLLKWEPARIARRTEELLHVVGLDPALMLHRYPSQLSGGQRQRVGVARALAADPPVLLMDEPFGALDPVARALLQSEFRQILERVRKTVVLVTHDLHEAAHLSDRIAIMNGGRIVQYDTPNAVLSRPATPFVENFVGVDRALVRLGLFTAQDVMSLELPLVNTVTIGLRTSLREALALMVSARRDVLGVVDESGVLRGSLTREAIFSL